MRLARGARRLRCGRPTSCGLLHWAGYGLDFARCRQCTDGIDEPAYFIIARGGVVCARCRPAIPDGALRLEMSSTSALVNLSEAHFVDALEAKAAAADGALAISRFVASVLDRRLRSITFLDSMLTASGAR